MMRRSLIFEISCCLLLPITCLCLHNFFFIGAEEKQLVTTPFNAIVVSSAIECHLFCNQNIGFCKSFNVLQLRKNGNENFKCQTFNYAVTIRGDSLLFNDNTNSTYWTYWTIVNIESNKVSTSAWPINENGKVMVMI